MVGCTENKKVEYQKKDINSQLSEVIAYQEKNDFGNANRLLESMIHENPNNAELYFRLAHSKTISDPNLFEIMHLLDECLKRDSSHYLAMYLKSQGLMFKSDFRGALEIENELLTVFPTVLTLKADKASTLLFCGEFEKAIQYSETILPECKYIDEAERLIRVQIYANYFLDRLDEVKKGKEELNHLGLETAYLQSLIDSKDLKFENFAIGKNVGNKPCTLDQLKLMFPQPD